MEAIDARNRGAAAQKNEAIEGRRPVVEVLNHIGEDPNPDRNRSYVKSWTRFRISEKRDPDPYWSDEDQQSCNNQHWTWMGI